MIRQLLRTGCANSLPQQSELEQYFTFCIFIAVATRLSCDGVEPGSGQRVIKQIHHPPVNSMYGKQSWFFMIRACSAGSQAMLPGQTINNTTKMPLYVRGLSSPGLFTQSNTCIYYRLLKLRSMNIAVRNIAPRSLQWPGDRQSPSDKRGLHLDHNSSSHVYSQAGEFLGHGRYEVVECLGKGSNAVTYKCKDLTTGWDVAVKTLSLGELGLSWKCLDLFEREAELLRKMRHPGIPKYIDYFEEDLPNDRRYYLVQELMPGASLEVLSKSGWQPSEQQIIKIAVSLLKILEYLSDHNLVHRDISPGNILVDQTGLIVSLVDFGGGLEVPEGSMYNSLSSDEDETLCHQRSSATGAPLRSTILGTAGFMAPEATIGAVSPASDAYSLGATLVFLASQGRVPSVGGRLRVHVPTSIKDPRLRTLLESLLEPIREDRLSATEALELLCRSSGRDAGDYTTILHQRGQRTVLQNTRNGPNKSEIALRPPTGSRLEIIRRGPRLEIEIPPARLSADALSTAAFAVAWNAFVGVWTVSAVAGGGILFGLFSLPFWAAGFKLSKVALAAQCLREKIVIGHRHWKLEQQIKLPFVGLRSRTTSIGGETGGLARAGIEMSGYVDGQPQSHVVIQHGAQTLVIGEALSFQEQEFAAGAINNHLQFLKTLRPDRNSGVLMENRDVDSFHEGGNGKIPESKFSHVPIDVGFEVGGRSTSPNFD